MAIQKSGFRDERNGSTRIYFNFLSPKAFLNMFDVVFLRGLCVISLPIIRLVVDTEGEKDSLYRR